MPGHAMQAGVRLGWFAITLVIVVLAVDGGVSRTEALDRWVGTAVLSGTSGFTISFDFIVLVDPGKGASYEWRSGGAPIFAGPLSAGVSGSTVTGSLSVTGGLARLQNPFCCRPCNFSGTIAGSRVDGTFDLVSCDGTGSFFLVKQ